MSCLVSVLYSQSLHSPMSSPVCSVCEMEYLVMRASKSDPSPEHISKVREGKPRGNFTIITQPPALSGLEGTPVLSASDPSSAPFIELANLCNLILGLWLPLLPPHLDYNSNPAGSQRQHCPHREACRHPAIFNINWPSAPRK